MCTEYITKHRLFPKDKTEFYKVLEIDNSNYCSPFYETVWKIGKKVKAQCYDGRPVTELLDHERSLNSCDFAIHLFENKEDAKAYATGCGLYDKLVLGIFHCDPDDFYCCGLTDDLLNMKKTWHPTACYNAATLVRVEEIDV